MNSDGRVSRRAFLATSAAVGGGLALAVWIRRSVREAPLGSGDAALAPDAWVRLGSDGWLTVVVARSEMGQGISTSLPMLVAEEMDADWDQVQFEFAPAHSAYYNPEMGLQATGGSTSIRGAWLPLRQAGATARAMLIAAAAAELDLPRDELSTEAGVVVHVRTGTRRSFGSLAEAAGRLPVPENVPLKDPEAFRLVGKPIPRLDTHDKLTGRTLFGIDAGPTDALVAVVARSPVFGGRARVVDDSRARAVPGVWDVVPIRSGVAVVADGYWSATQGRAALQVEWEDAGAAEVNSEAIAAGFRALADGPGRKARQVGDAGAVIAASANRLGAEYSLPFLAHACMEPMNCTADVRADQVTVWAPTQFQAAPRVMAGGGARGVAAAIAGVPIEQVEIITTFLGGGFGRRSEQDFVAEACEVSKAVRRPVKVIYSREDDVQHDFYRPASFHRLTAAVDTEGRPAAWQHRVVSPSILARFIPDAIPDALVRLAGPMRGGIDPSSVEGIVDLPYDTGTLDISYTQAESPVPVGYWRSVGHSANAFVVESFIDELAALAGQDPVAYRLGLLGGHPRHTRVLQAAADAATWGAPLPAGRARGVALHESFGSIVAQVAEVSVEEGAVRVHRVTCAIDCGMVVNPDTVVAQMQGGIGFGLSAALGEEVRIEAGRVVQSNFHDYSVLRMSQMPAIEVVLVPSGDAPGGVGEPGTPPIAPAVANAIFALTGQRIRNLPIRLS